MVNEDERKALEQSHKQYQDLCAKIIALMIDELGEDIVRVFVDEGCDDETEIEASAGICSGKYARKGSFLNL